MKLLQDMDVDNKRVIVRCDFNVPIKDNKILDDYKIVKSLDTIKYLLERNCKIILLSHLGKVKKESDKETNSLEIVANRLKELLQVNVIFSKQTRNYGLETMVMNLNPRDILLLENTRYEDVPDKLESNCDAQLSSYWANLGEVFVMDAFGSSHRRHASTYGITKYLPSCVGLLVQQELKMLNSYVLNASHPFTIIMGGAKIDDKLALINKLLPKCDHMLLTGGLANTCIKVLGFNVGKSLASSDEETLKNVSDMLVKYKDKIVLPLDVIVCNAFDDSYLDQKGMEEIDENDEIKDIGGKTIEEFKKIIDESQTIFVNGTAGVYEDNRFANGTKELLNILANSNANVIIGGGDAASAVNNCGFANEFTFVSTGGGATLEYIINESLAAIDGSEKVETL